MTEIKYILRVSVTHSKGSGILDILRTSKVENWEDFIEQLEKFIRGLDEYKGLKNIYITNILTFPIGQTK